MRTIKREIVGGFLFSKDDKLLLGKSRKGGVYPDCWLVPGGGVDEGETNMEALRREMLEETGIDITEGNVSKFPGVLSGESKKTLKDTNEVALVKMRFHNFIIKMPYIAGEISLKTEDDFIDAAWFERTQLRDLALSPPTITSLQKIGYL